MESAKIIVHSLQLTVVAADPDYSFHVVSFTGTVR